MKTICFYHKNCMDGKASAAVVHRKYPDTEFWTMKYGDPMVLTKEELADADVYIVDFSFPIEVMRELKANAHDVTWLDHHKTSIPIRDELGWGTVTMDECGATLTWKILYGENMPHILKFVRDRDLWEWRMPFSREVSEALAHRYPDDGWGGLLDLNPRDLIGEGKEHLELKRKQVYKNCERAYPVLFEGFKAMAVNSYEYTSETGEALLKLPDVQVAIMYWREKDKWINSLRSASPDVDVSAVAKKYNGGGHAQAAGFTSLTLLSELDILIRPE